MILISPRMKAALEREAVFLTKPLDTDVFPDLIAGESEVVIDGQRYGVLRLDRRGAGFAKAVLIRMPEYL